MCGHAPFVRCTTLLLFSSQELVGGSAKFEPFFRQYVQTFAGTPLTSDDFKARLAGRGNQTVNASNAVHAIITESRTSRHGQGSRSAAMTGQARAPAAFGRALLLHDAVARFIGWQSRARSLLPAFRLSSWITSKGRRR